MKINKAILAAVIGAGVVSSALAGDVFITGSTAMRSTMYNALLTDGVVFHPAPTFTGWGGGGSGDSYMAFSGTLVGGSGTTTVLCEWSGSEAGIKDVVAGTSETFLSDGYVSANLGTDTGSGTPSGANAQTASANLAMADSSQAFSRSTSPTLTQGSEVGIINFKWVRNQGVWQGSNVTDAQIQAALSGGAPIEVFTGVNDGSADTNYVYVSGRDTGSGTRVNALGDCGYGIFTPTAQITLSAGAMVAPYTSATNGQSSGGTLAKSMTYNTSAAHDYVNNLTGFSVIAYLGKSDAATAITGTGSGTGGVGCTELTYNGVAFSVANIENGTYTFWGNEYCYTANSVNATATPEAQRTYNNIVSNVHGADTAFGDFTSAIPLDAMQCSRSGPTGQPSHY